MFLILLTYMHANIHTNIHTYIHTYLYTYTHTYTHTQTHTHACTYRYIYKYIQIYIHIYMLLMYLYNIIYMISYIYNYSDGNFWLPSISPCRCVVRGIARALPGYLLTSQYINRQRHLKFSCSFGFNLQTSPVF